MRQWIIMMVLSLSITGIAIEYSVQAKEIDEAIVQEIEERKLDPKIEEAIELTTKYMIQNVVEPTFGVIGGEWAILGLARNEATVPEGYYKGYIDSVAIEAMSQHTRESRGWGTKVTETQRLAVALAALGADIEDFNGINLVDYTWNKGKNMPDLSEEHQILGNRQGLNELCWGLITLDLYQSEQPEDATITRDEIINRMIDEYSKPEGGFSLSGGDEEIDVDITAMAITSLAPYYEKEGYEHVTQVINQSLGVLSELQGEDGGFRSGFMSVEGNTGSNAESASQVIVALCSLGIDPTEDERFIKGDNDLLTHLLSFQLENGGFEHISGEGANQMATEQAYYALVAYKRLVLGQSSLYDMSEVEEVGELGEE